MVEAEDECCEKEGGRSLMVKARRGLFMVE